MEIFASLHEILACLLQGIWDIGSRIYMPLIIFMVTVCSNGMVSSLLGHCCSCLYVLCLVLVFVISFLVSFLAWLFSQRGRESWLLYFNCSLAFM